MGCITVLLHRQASEAIAYMHDEMKMAHRDIKVDNVLLNDGRAKVTDFGFACRFVDDNGNIKMSATFCGTAVSLKMINLTYQSTYSNSLYLHSPTTPHKYWPKGGTVPSLPISGPWECCYFSCSTASFRSTMTTKRCNTRR